MNRSATFLLFIALQFVVPRFSMAQNIEQTPHIDVTGYAQIEAIPNQILLQICIKEFFDGKIKVNIPEQESKMKNMLKISGIDLTKLKPVEVQNDYVKITKTSRENSTEKKFHLLLSNTNSVVNAYQVLNDLGINNVKVISVSHTNIDSLIKAVETLAITNARDKAKSLLAALDSKLGKPLIIRENDYFSGHNNRDIVSFPNKLVETKLEDNIIEDSEVILYKKIFLHTSIFVRFAIE